MTTTIKTTRPAECAPDCPESYVSIAKDNPLRFVHGCEQHGWEAELLPEPKTADEFAGELATLRFPDAVAAVEEEVGRGVVRLLPPKASPER